MKMIQTEKIIMKMPNKTKAALYAQMALNQLQAAILLAKSETPKIHSVIWLQLAYFAIELSTKAYLLSIKEFSTEKQLREFVKHKFDKYLKINPEIQILFNEENDQIIKEYYIQYELYIKQEHRYLGSKNIFIGNGIDNKYEFLEFIKKIIDANVEGLQIDNLTSILNT